ncbi:lipopolysaccharide biosynthesis protein [Sporosarcina sp. ACRSL]|uniref:lipopolysaccharide biosynthesis protein n=1 Tax=Sporosarcina sp. ACRSL TaxID=2918215 RepID=UPI001EF5E8E3|nr:lipopolysaccharide biosynthesis protein [Sporosarcina sp. ACRSL]MCG7345453.1 lipopolysaccharide biosynthesis protein [Sporosarcina sp. ACRSL]
MPTPMSLKSKTIIGVFWSFMDLMANHGIQFGVQIILARLLLPEHFGLIGMILVLIAVSNAIVDSGFSQALIRDQHTTQEDYSTVFYFNLFISLVLYGLLFSTANMISVFFEEPQLTNIIRVISLVLIINSLAIIQKAMLVKKVDFKTLTKVSFIAVITSGSLTIFLAMSGFGVWSLVINMIALQSVQTGLLWYFNKWIPSLTFKVQSFKKFYSFGYKLLISGLIDTFFYYSYFVIIGRMYHINQLGYYTKAVNMKDLASFAIVSTVQRVTYPVLSSIQQEKERLKYGFKSVIKISAFINFPLMVGLAAVAKPLFIVVFGEKWIPSVTYFQLLCFAGMLYPLHSINLNVLQVKGRSDLILLLEIIKKSLLAIMIILSILLGFGIIGLIWTAVINSFVSFLLNSYFSAREIEYSSIEQIKDLLPSFLISFCMGIVVFLVGNMIDGNHLLQLISQITIGIAIYIIISKIVRVQELNTLYQMALPIVNRIKNFRGPS